MKRRVAITGLGVVSAVGIGLEDFWAGLVSGRSGVTAVTRFDPDGLPVRIAAQISDFDLRRYADAPLEYRRNGDTCTLDARTQFAFAAAEMAVRDASLERGEVWTDATLYFGAGEGDNDVPLLGRIIMPHATACGCAGGAVLGDADVRPFGLRDQLMEPTAPASLLAERHGVTGEVTTCLTACAASAQAVGEAFRRIQAGECDLALTGGSHAMTAPLDLLGFAMLSALSQRNDDPARAPRPFDRHRDGFVLGEGAAVVILEEWESARRRGARIRAELIGYGAANDAYRVTDMHPDARGARRAIVGALNDAGVDPSDIGYVNAHGTSTIENDRAETHAIRAAFGDSAGGVPVSSTKSMTGHAVAAAGAIELVATVLALETQVLPPTINLETPDPECDLDYVPNTARQRDFDVALTNSFGFGGQNVTLAVRRPEGWQR